MLVSLPLSGTPVAALAVNRRPERMWVSSGKTTGPSFAVIDGKQRLSTLVLLLSGQLAVPASWFPRDGVLATEETADSPYVRWEWPGPEAAAAARRPATRGGVRQRQQRRRRGRDLPARQRVRHSPVRR